jgi:subtilisin-like proprotein convertase family protein
MALLAGPSARADVSASFTSLNKTIPDGNPVGVADTETVNAGAGQQITGITLSLNISGGYNGDLFGYVANDSGGYTVLLNRVGRSASSVGGYSDSGFNVTFAVGSPNIHTYQSGSYNITAGQLTGTWGADGRTTDPNLTLTSDPVNSSLTSFYGTNPTGAWTLFLADMDFGDGSATLNSWSLDIQTAAAVPEPSAVLLLSLAGALAGAGCFRSRAKA